MKRSAAQTPKQLTEAQVVGTSLVVSVLDIVVNLAVGLATGSAVMLAQALQGLSDLTTAGFLFVGVRRSRAKPDDRHPFGYGRELFFWTLMAAMIMFIGTGGLSLYLGLRQVISPEPVARLGLALAVLAFGFATNVYAFSRSLRRLRERGVHIRSLRDFFDAGLIETKTTLFVDLIGTLAALLGLLSLGLYALTGNAIFDGVGAVAVALLTMLAAVVIMLDLKGLITGRAVPATVAADIRRAALAAPGVRGVLDLRALYIGSTSLLVVLEVHLDDGFTTDDIERVLDDIKARVARDIPEPTHIQIEVETPDSEISVTMATGSEPNEPEY